MRKTCTWFILVFLFFAALPKLSQASHLVGAEITWKYLGSDTFLGSVIIERDCNGVPMPDQPFTIIPCGSTSGVYVNTVKTGGLDITPVCKNYCTRCSQSDCDFPSGFENYIFSAKFCPKAIDSNCCDFRIVWQACCRNGAITTGSATENYYLEASMNPCIKPRDNSPVFINPPLMLAEVGQCLSYTFAASDPDVDANGFHDSLVYALDTPYQSYDQPVDFAPGYAYNHPILYYGSSPNDPWYPDCKGFHLDPTTGDLMFKAVKEDITQVVVRVEEWGKDANGKPYKKGETRRDVTFFTMPSTGDQVPSFSGFNGANNYVANFCAGQKQCLSIYSYDADTNNFIHVASSDLPPGLSNATLSVDTSSKTPSTIFCWQPDSSQIGKTYQFVLNAADNNCPLVGKTARTYTINILPSPKAKASVTNPACGNVIFRITPQKNSPVASYYWTGSDGLSGTDTVIQHHYQKAGIYHWTVYFSNKSGCTDTAGGTVIVPAYVNVSVSPKDTLVCLSKNPVINLKTSVSSGTGPYSYSWSSDGVTLPDSTDQLSLAVTKDTILIATVTDKGTHCSNWDTAFIKASTGVTPVKLIPPKDTLTCMGQNITLVAKATGGDSTKYMYLWEPSGVKQNKYEFTASQTETQKISISDGCSIALATVHISIRPPLIIHTSKDTSICPGKAIVISATGTGGDSDNYLFTWGGSLGVGPSKTVSPVITQNYSVILTDGCSTPATGSVTVGIYPEPVSKASALNTTLIQNGSVQFENASSNANSYLWKFGDDSESIFEAPLHQYIDTGYFSVVLIATNAEGCMDSSVLKNYIHVLPAFYVYIPNAFTPNSDSLNDCFGPKGQAIKDYTLEIFSRLGNPVFKGNTCWDGTFKGLQLPDGMFIYHITVTDLYGIMHSYSGPFYLLN